MPIVTLRDMPDDLQAFLKADAAANHRSLNKQIISALDEYRRQKSGLSATRVDVAQQRAQVDALLESIRRKLNPDDRPADRLLGYGDDGLPS